MSVTTSPFYNLEGKEVTIFTRSGRKIEGIYFGVATHGWHVVELSSDPAGRMDRREFIPFDMVESVQLQLHAPMPPAPPAFQRALCAEDEGDDEDSDGDW